MDCGPVAPMPYEFTRDTVRQLRADFLLLMRNADRVSNWREARAFQQAVTRFRGHLEELVYQGILPALKAKHGEGAAAQDIAKQVWALAIELSVPLGDPHSPLTWEHSPDATEEGAFARYQRARVKWLARVKSKARGAWRALEEYFDYLSDAPLPYQLPTREQMEVAGFRVIVKNAPDNAARYLERVAAGLEHYRRRAGRVLPWMVTRALPFVVDFKPGNDNGGTYNHDGTITLHGYYGSRPQAADSAQVIAHEMGHHVWEAYLSDADRAFWQEAIAADYGDLDLRDVLAVWPAGEKGGQYWIEGHSLRETDPRLYLQIYMCMHPPLDDQRWFKTREDVEALLAAGTRTVKVPRNPISVYARKNPEEAFCEALSHLVAYGPGAVYATVRWWLGQILPQLKVASRTAEKVVEVFHVSPESDITRFRGRYSPKFGARGLFVSPSFRAIKQDWAGYVGGKRVQNIPKGHPRPRERGQRVFDNLTVYRLELPERIYREAEAHHRALADAALQRDPQGGAGAWGWGLEVFLPEEALEFVRIAGRKTYPIEYFTRKNRRPDEERDEERELPALARTNPAARLYLEVSEYLLNQALRRRPGDSTLLTEAKGVREALHRLIYDRRDYRTLTPITRLQGAAAARYARLRGEWDRIRAAMESPLIPDPVRVAARFQQTPSGAALR